MAEASYENDCFFITPIGEPDSEIREQADGVMNTIVGPAAKEFDLDAIRADDLPEPGQITSQVIVRVIHSKMVVADLSQGNPNVYYELAIRNAFRKPVALLAEKGTTLPFDTNQMRTIFYKPTNMNSVASARDDLVAHIESALKGAIDSPVTTAVDLDVLRAGSAVERQLAELVQGVETLSVESRRSMEIILGRQRSSRGVTPLVYRDLEMAREGIQEVLDNDEELKQQLAEPVSFLSRAMRHLRHHAVAQGEIPVNVARHLPSNELDYYWTARDQYDARFALGSKTFRTLLEEWKQKEKDLGEDEEP